MNKWLIGAGVLILLIVIVWFLYTKMSVKVPPQDLDQVKATSVGSKKVILLVVDSLLTEALEEGLRQNVLPTFRYLKEHGIYEKELVSAFPTMSVAIDSTLITGTYPDRYHIPGLIWYSSKLRSLVNYGTGPMEIMTSGLNPVLYNAFISLNETHLSRDTPTIYEELDRQGRTSGSINGLVYRGTKDHELTIPPWISGVTLLPDRIRVKGPDLLSFGIFSNPLSGVVDLTDDPFHRLGLNSYYSLETASYLVKEKKLPDFLYVYLPDLDKPLHKKGPSQLEVVRKVDQQLGEFLQQFGSLEEAGRQAVFVLIGDSGVSKIGENKEESIVKLYELLGQYRVLPPWEQVSEETEVVLAVNETMAYVYKLKEQLSLREMAGVLQAETRMDLIAWKGEEGWIHVMRTGDGQEMRYRVGGRVKDRYDQAWSIEGAAGEVLDLRFSSDGHIVEYGDYPDSLQRLYGALHSHEGEFLVVTAKPGFELADRSSPAHVGGGAHGSLHRKETLIPLMIYGTEERPEKLRIVDLKSYLLKLVGSKA
jgi:hypothetical protein